MADVHSKKIRSYNMSQIKSRNTKPELLVRKYLFSKGYRYKLHDKNLPGKPDIVLPKYKTVIFVHGCFWHGHSACKYFVLPKTKSKWWKDKIEGNKQRDLLIFSKLKKDKWKIITIFECELKLKAKEKSFNKMLSLLKTRVIEKRSETT